MCDGSGPKRPLPFAADPSDGAVGQAGLHTYPAAATLHEKAAIQVRHHEVSLRYRNSKLLNNFRN